MESLSGGSAALPVQPLPFDASSLSLRDVAGRQEDRARSGASSSPLAGATRWLEDALLGERQAVQSLMKKRHDMLISKLAAQAQTNKSCQLDPITQLAGGIPDDGRLPESRAQCNINLPGDSDTDDMSAVDAAEAVDKGNSVTMMGFSTDDDDSKGANLNKFKDESSQSTSSRKTGRWCAHCFTVEDKRLCQLDLVTQPAGFLPDDGRSPESRAQGTSHLPGAFDTDGIFTADAAGAVGKGKGATTAWLPTDDEGSKGADARALQQGSPRLIERDSSCANLLRSNSSSSPTISLQSAPPPRGLRVRRPSDASGASCMSGFSNSPTMSFQSGKLQRASSRIGESLLLEESSALLRVVSSPCFEFAVAGLITLNAFAMALEMQYRSFGIGHQLQYRWHGWSVHGTLQFEGPAPYEEHVWPWGVVLFEVLDWVFGIVFTCELIVKVSGYRWAWFKDSWNYLDAAIVCFWLVERSFSNLLEGHSSLLRLCRVFRLFRLLKVVRTLKSLDQLYLLLTSLKGCFWILGWSCLLLLIVQMLCAMLMWLYLTETYFTSEEYPLEERQAVFEYFGSFSRGMLTMFEMTLANWPPVCRLLVESVNEGFLILCLIHKLTLGFAVVGVINGVFLQETFKVASTDDRIMVRQRERDVKMHTDKMVRLFEAADTDKNGELDVDEFVQILQDPTILTWMSSMEIPVRDPENLYHLLDDDGNGGLSCEEVVQGTLKMKGSAKSLDIMSMNCQLAEARRELREFGALLARAPSYRCF